MKPVKNRYHFPKVGDHIRRGGEYGWMQFFTVAKIYDCSTDFCPRARGGGCSAKQVISFEGCPEATYCINTNWVEEVANDIH